MQTNRQVDSIEADEIRNLNKEQRVIHYLKSHDSISTQQAMELCEYKTRAGARRLLDKMIQNDILKKQEVDLVQNIYLMMTSKKQ